MHSSLRLWCGVVALLCCAGQASATFSGSGTISPGSPSVSYTGGTYSISNPTPTFTGAAGVSISPVCSDDICDRFEVTVANIPANYLLLHPLDRLNFTIHWPDANADFDMWLYDSTGDVVINHDGVSGANPEAASLPIQAGTTRYVIRVVPYTVLPTGDSFSGSVALGPGPAPPPDIFHASDHVDGTDVFSCNLHLSGVDANGASHASDKEPAVRFDRDGIAYVTSNGAGSGLWTVTEPCGNSYTFMGLADLNNGGGDTDVEVGTVRNANGFYNVYSSALHSTDALVNINSSVSYDGGRTFLTTPVSDPTPVNDRNWNAAYGKDVYYLSYRTLNTGNQQFVVRAQATEGQPLILSPPVPVYSDPNVQAEGGFQVGNLVADRRPMPPGTPAMTAGINGQGNVYHGFTTAGTHVYVAVSRDFGTTWTDTKVFDAPDGMTCDHIFTWVAVDDAGNVYTAFADDKSIYYSVSADIRTSNTPHWSIPVRVSSGPWTKSSALPTMAAGSAGRLVFSWYGTPATGSQDANAQWHVFFARCNNALDALSPVGRPVIEQSLVSDHIVHEGALCQAGTLGCSGNTRALLDDFEIDVHPLDGSAFITFTDDGPVGGTFISRQLAGKSAIDGVEVEDLTGVCPVAAGDCAGAPEPRGSACTLPGYRAVDDAPNDAGGNFGSPQMDILKLYVAEPQPVDGIEKITFTIKVASLRPDSLPLNRVWRMFFTNPTAPETTYFVSMSTCRPTQIPAFDFGFTNSATGTQTGLGSADEGTVAPDGTIRITMAKRRVGNSTTAGDVLFHADIGTDIRSIKGTTYFVEGANCTGLLEPVDETGSGTYHVSGNCNLVVGVPPQASPSQLALALGTGNPFRGRTELLCNLPRASRLRVAVYGVDGRKVCTLLDAERPAGVQHVPFDLETSAGRKLGAGVYLVRMEAGGDERRLRVIGLR